MYLLNERILASMKANKITTSELSEKTGIDYTSLWKFLNGKRNFTTRNINKILSHVNLIPEKLVFFSAGRAGYFNSFDEKGTALCSLNLKDATFLLAKDTRSINRVKVGLELAGIKYEKVEFEVKYY